MSDHLHIEDDEYEEISSNEVDSVVEALELLADKVDSETIRAMLEDTAAEIHNLFYDDSLTAQDEAA